MKKYDICIVSIAAVVFITIICSCGNPRINEKKEWGDVYKKAGITNGAFEILEQSKERVYFYNKEAGNTAITPGNTFHILLGLIALERDIVSNEDEAITKDTLSKWTTDISLATAIKTNNIEVFQNIARKIGKDELQIWIDTIRYGNKMVKAPIDSCWMNGTLKVTPDEHVGFLKKMYFDNLPFSTRSQKIMRTLLVKQDKMQYRLFNTGGSIIDSGRQKYLQIGYLEDSTAHPYFFANSFDYDASKYNGDSLASQLTRSAFNTMNLMLSE